MDDHKVLWMPSAKGVPAYVADFVKRVTSANRLPLDYSVNSLRLVDFVVDGIRKRGPRKEGMEQTLFALGAYVGEVFVRHVGASWVDLDASQQRLFAQSVGIRMPDGRVWNPLGKVANRFLFGPEESVQQLFLQLHGRRPRGQGDERGTACGS